jgi:hypothetical protein
MDCLFSLSSLRIQELHTTLYLKLACPFSPRWSQFRFCSQIGGEKIIVCEPQDKTRQPKMAIVGLKQARMQFPQQEKNKFDYKLRASKWLVEDISCYTKHIFRAQGRYLSKQRDITSASATQDAKRCISSKANVAMEDASTQTRRS